MFLGKPYDPKTFGSLTKLGAGAYSNVYLTHGYNKTIVIKQLDKADPKVRDIDILSEVGILSYLKHSCDKHVMCFLDFLEDAKYFSIITEYLDHYVTLEDFIKQLPDDPDVPTYITII
jgi:serine/threonine protein kinase